MADNLGFASTLNQDLFFKLLFAFVAGFIGSSAYVSILYFKFIGGKDKERNLILSPFLSKSMEHLLVSDMHG